MTEDELVQIERVAELGGDVWSPGIGLARVHWEAMRALVAEVRRLRGLVNQAEWAAGYCCQSETRYSCPWCDEDEGGVHAPTCPAFPPET